MRTESERQLAFQLKEKGLNNTEIAKVTGVPRKTIVDWFAKGQEYVVKSSRTLNDIIEELKRDSTMRLAYSYVLGLYLGDGYINKFPRTYRLRVALDKKYPKLNEYAAGKMRQLLPHNDVGIVNFPTHINISVYSKDLAMMFPQHGVGKKHSRNVSLQTWQHALLDDVQFLKGLFHSDGCFYRETINEKYTYERFCFSNMSRDIQRMFQAACQRHGIDFDVTIGKTNAMITRVSKKDHVRKMKQMIGTKIDILA